MNKQGLITLLMMEKISAEVRRRGSNYAKGYENGIELAIKLIEASEDEPQKPVVPQFAAEWIDVCKENSAIGLYTAINLDFLKQYNKSNELITWLRKHKNQDIFARAWLDGYEIEREKRYLVKMKGVVPGSMYLKHQIDANYWYFGADSEKECIAIKHTRKELKEAGFNWVFDYSGVEVEEV